jgi:hypothetical protein
MAAINYKTIEIETVPCKTVDEFVDYLRPYQPHWKENARSSGFHINWFFRGQADANKKLFPSLFRPDGKPSENAALILQEYLGDESLEKFDREAEQSYNNNKWVNVSLDNIKKSMYVSMAEILVINEFVDLAQKALGITIPDISSWDEIVAESIAQPGNVVNRPRLSHPAAAIAQHHGIKTRLLDWTYNPINAALFAASGQSEESTELGVFAFHPSHFENTYTEIYKPPPSVTAFLHAQEGLFTVNNRNNLFFNSYARFPSIDEGVAVRGDYVEPEPAKKVTLPIAKRFELFTRLWLENYTNAHLMPNLDNVAKSVKLKIQGLSE